MTRCVRTTGGAELSVQWLKGAAALIACACGSVEPPSIDRTATSHPPTRPRDASAPSPVDASTVPPEAARPMDASPAQPTDASRTPRCQTTPLWVWDWAADSLYRDTPTSLLTFSADGQRLAWLQLEYSPQTFTFDALTGSTAEPFWTPPIRDPTLGPDAPTQDAFSSALVYGTAVDVNLYVFNDGRPTVAALRGQVVSDGEGRTWTLTCNSDATQNIDLLAVDETGEAVAGPWLLGMSERCDPVALVATGGTIWASASNTLLRVDASDGQILSSAAAPGVVRRVVVNEPASVLVAVVSKPDSEWPAAELTVFDALRLEALNAPLASVAIAPSGDSFVPAVQYASAAVHPSGAVAYFDPELQLVLSEAPYVEAKVIERERLPDGLSETGTTRDQWLPAALRFSPDGALLARVRGTELAVFECFP